MAQLLWEESVRHAFALKTIQNICLGSGGWALEGSTYLLCELKLGIGNENTRRCVVSVFIL